MYESKCTLGYPIPAAPISISTHCDHRVGTNPRSSRDSSQFGRAIIGIHSSARSSGNVSQAGTCRRYGMPV